MRKGGGLPRTPVEFSGSRAFFVANKPGKGLKKAMGEPRPSTFLFIMTEW